MKTSLNIGITATGSVQWMGGLHYVENLIRALATLPFSQRPDVYLVVFGSADAGDLLYRSVRHLVAGRITVDGQSSWPLGPDEHGDIRCSGLEELFTRIDFLYPAPRGVSSVCSAQWLCDFQHTDLPHFFPLEERLARDAIFGQMADGAPLTVVSSHAMAHRFGDLYPTAKSQIFELPFRTVLIDDWFGDQSDFAKRYALPERYLVCCNQFWMHKDHPTLFRALSLLKESGSDVHLVCTGVNSDYRNSGYAVEIINMITSLGLGHLVKMLGIVPRNDQIQIIRQSMGMVQPSRYEGWSSVVEDSRALGKAIFLSDIAVHREQAPPKSRFFRTGDEEHLSHVIMADLPYLGPGPDRHDESVAREQSRVLVTLFAEEFCRLAQRARMIYAALG